MAKVNFAVTVTGRVQGISFRYYAAKQADQLGVTGWVRNNPDGSVSLEIEGESALVDHMLAWCRHGPPFAQVTDISIHPGQIKNHSSFDIAP